jgi:hypothetical protein
VEIAQRLADTIFGARHDPDNTAALPSIAESGPRCPAGPKRVPPRAPEHSIKNYPRRGGWFLVQRFDGFVARYMGDGVLVYFGYPRAHEDDAERAVQAGLELVER